MPQRQEVGQPVLCLGPQHLNDVGTSVTRRRVPDLFQRQILRLSLANGNPFIERPVSL
jgi:hypothetical protein